MGYEKRFLGRNSFYTTSSVAIYMKFSWINEPEMEPLEKPRWDNLSNLFRTGQNNGKSNWRGMKIQFAKSIFGQNNLY